MSNQSKRRQGPAESPAPAEAGAGSCSNNQENIKVSVRLRPFTERERQRQSKRIVDIEQNTVALYNPRFPQEEAKKFTFDHSYWSHDGFRRNEEGVNVPDPAQPNCAKYVGQERVFADLGRFLLDNALEGYNSALLAYGQTGSGKSYTVSGYGHNEGILPRFARELFAELERRATEGRGGGGGGGGGETTAPRRDSDGQASPAERGNRYEVFFSMIEIYNEVVRDLLAKQNGYSSQTSSSIVRRGLRVREHPKKGFFVENLTSYPCANKDEIESLIAEGQMNKSIAATSMNETSSRGHTIYEFRIRQFKMKPASAEPPASPAPAPAPRPAAPPPPTPTRSQPKRDTPHKRQTPDGDHEIETTTTSVVQLVDLAGSERMTVHLTGELAGDSLRPSSRSGSPFNSATNIAEPGRSARTVRSSTTVRRAPTSASSSSSAATTVQSQSLRRAGKQAQQQQHSIRGPTGNLLGPNMNSSQQQRFKESVSINQSLSALGNCIQVLSQFSQQQLLGGDPATSAGSNSKQPKIPYRDSVLTKLLNRCCLSGNSKVVLIATLSPVESNFDDTLSTLRFADRAKQIRTHAVVNRSVHELAAGHVAGLQRENERLKQMLDGRVTRSDDSSQTSNFDDTENMQDNFDGPKSSPGAELSSRPPPRGERSAAVIKTKPSRKTGARSQAAQTGGRKPKSHLRLAQENLLSNKRQQRLEGAGASTSLRGRRGGPAAANSNAKMRSSASSPAIATSDQMQALVSPAEQKMGQKMSPSELAMNGLELNSDEDDDDEEEDEEEDEGAGEAALAARNEQRLRKSRSLGQGLGNGAQGDYDSGSELLDEVDEQAGLIDEDNLLSPDSEESFNIDGAARAKFDENMSLEEKNKILNQLGSGVSNAAGRRFQTQLEGGGGAQRSPTDRPKVAGAKQHIRPTKRADLAAGAASKKSTAFLVNLNQDEQLTNRIAYVLETSGETLVGKDPSCDLLIYGPGIRSQHAKLIRAAEPEGAVRFQIEPVLDDGEPKHKAPPAKSQAKRGAVFVNGEPILERTRLGHGDRLLLGSTNYFVFVDSETGAPPDSVTYDMAQAEVMSRLIGEPGNEAMLREIKDYTHRPGTGKKRPRDSDEGGAAVPAIARDGSLDRANEQPEVKDDQQTRQQAQLGNIKEEEGGELQSARDEGQDEFYRSKLMAEAYDVTMPVEEANKMAAEMGIKVTYGLKILTGDEQLEPDIDEVMAAELQEAEEGGEPAGERAGSGVLISADEPIRPATLDVPPDLYVHVRLDELQVDFFWSKEKFQERRVKMLELYGAWDVGGKSGLVEYLIEQSKYQGYFMVDPFIDDLRTSWVLVGHAQVTLQPVAHVASLRESFDVLDVADEIVGSVRIEALPCHCDGGGAAPGWPYQPMDERELAEGFLKDPSELLGKRFVFLLRVVACSRVPSKFAQVFCQYALNRDQPAVRARPAEKRLSDDGASATFQYEHKNFVVIERVTEDILDFLRHGFLTIQLVSQYDASVIDQAAQGGARRSTAGSSGSQRASSQPTLVSTIISSINKYRFRMEQQSAGYSNAGYPSQSAYANSLSDSANSASAYRHASSSVMNSNSGPSSVTSASATFNLFDQHDEDLHSISQHEDLIDMILTKRKLDRAQNQLHYIKRTINIAEHHNKKHIPVRTVKKLLTSYGQEADGGSLEAMAAEVTAEPKGGEAKHSNCAIQ